MPEPATRAQDTVTLDSSPTMAMTTLYGAAVGPIGKDYYLPIFSRFEAAGQATLSWNWSACLYSLNWMFFRRLWGAALVFVGALLGVALLLVALGSLVFEWPSEMLYQMLLTCLVLALVVSGAWGNALLYNRCRQAMMTAVADNKTLVQACAQLSLQASTRQRFIRLLLANALLLALAAAAATYLMLPRDDIATTGLSDPAQTPALAASQAASVALEPASAALEPASAASAASTEAAALSAMAAASTPSSAPAAVSSSAPTAVPTAAPSSVPATAAASASAPVSAAAPAAVPAPPSALAALQAAPKTVKLAAPTHAKATASASSHPASAARTKAAATAKAHASAPAHAASKPAAKATKTSPVKPTHAATPASAPAKALYINAGLFANADNARNALAKLQAAGLPAFSQELETSQGPRTRIRVGPVATPAEAETTIEKIKALNLDAALVKP